MENIVTQDSNQNKIQFTAENIRSLMKFLQRATLNPSEIDEFLNLLKAIQLMASAYK